MAKAIETLKTLKVGHFGLGQHGDAPGSVRQQVHDGDTINVRALGNFGVWVSIRLRSASPCLAKPASPASGRRDGRNFWPIPWLPVGNCRTSRVHLSSICVIIRVLAAPPIISAMPKRPSPPSKRKCKPTWNAT